MKNYKTGNTDKIFKKHFLLILTLLIFLTGCSKNSSSQADVNNPYEIVKGSSTLSYYQTEDEIAIDGFEILELEPQNVTGLLSQNKNCILVRDGNIRCIYVADQNIVTYKQISVGDSIDKIKNSFSNVSQSQDVYNVLFNNGTEVNPFSQDKEDDWIWITYYTDGSKITSIQVNDVLYGSRLR